MIEYCLRFGFYDNVAILHTSESYGDSGAYEIQTYARAYGVSIGRVANVELNNGASLDAALTAVASYKVVLIYSVEPMVAVIIQQASNRGLLVRGKVWMFSSTINGILKTNFQNQYQLVNAPGVTMSMLNGLLVLKPYTGLFAKDMFYNTYKDWSEEGLFDRYAYDAVLAYVYAARDMIRRGQSINNGDLLRNALAATDYLGATGNLQLNLTICRTNNFQKSRPFRRCL